MPQPTNKRLVTEAAVAGHVNTEVTTPGTPTEVALTAKYAPARKVDLLAEGAAADGVTDDWAKFVAARTKAGANGTVHFAARNGAAVTKYYLAGSRPSLENVFITADPTVVIKVDENPNTKVLKLATPITIENPVAGTTQRKPANLDLPLAVAMAANVVAHPTKLVAEDFTVGWNASTYVGTLPLAGSGGFTGTIIADVVSWASAFGSDQQILWTRPNIGAKYDATFKTTATSAAGYFSIVVTSSDAQASTAEWRFSVGAATITRLLNNAGSTAVTSPTGNQNSYTVPLSGSAIVAIRVVSANDVEIFINDQLVDRYTLPFSIYRVGFGVDSAASATGSLRRPVRWDASQPNTARAMKYSIIGDSQSYSAWSPYGLAELLPVAFAGIPGGGGATLLNNYSVSGTSAQAWGSGGAYDVATKDFTGCDYVLVNLGTNNVQGALGLSTFMTAIIYISNTIVAAGAVPVFGVWAQFNDESLTGTGVDTSNYAMQAEYRSPLIRHCATNNYPLANMNAIFGNNPQWFLDNIHPGPEGQAAYAKAYAVAIANHRGMTRPSRASGVPWTAVPSGWFTNSWTNGSSGGAQFRYNENGDFELRGRISGGTAPSAAITIPQNYRPSLAYAAKTRGVSGSTEVIGTINVATTGVLTVSEGGTTLTSVDNVRWSTI